MAPAKSTKPEIPNNWDWTNSVPPEEISLKELLTTYRLLDYKPCDDQRRNCKRNPWCYWGLGEKKWVHDEDGSDEEDNEFRGEGEFAGLQNLGATCYVNSLLQLWFHNPVLRPAILQWEAVDGREIDELYTPMGPMAQLQAMFARMKMSKKSKIDPTEFVKTLQLNTGEQQDAQEFSKLFMEVIIKMLGESESADSAITRAISNAFRGRLQNETECTKCHNKTRREEMFNELELGVRKNLNESLDELLKEERLDGSEQYFCSVCQEKNDALRRTQLLELPPVLNLQLMRFVFDRETYRKKKVHTIIQFPEVLNMSNKVFPGEEGSNSKETKVDPKKQYVYHLSAVLIHNGSSASSGHYVAQIRDLRTGDWHTFNDETVDRVAKKSKKLVLKEDEENGSEPETSKTTKKTKTAGNHSSNGAYMLVYTLEQYVKDPAPDPDLWPYLEQLVKTEDESYEEEVKRAKNDKEYENNLKDQRKREISMLYPTLQLNKPSEKAKSVKSEEEEDDNDFVEGPPRKKLARTSDSDAVNGTTTPPAPEEMEEDADADTENKSPSPSSSTRSNKQSAKGQNSAEKTSIVENEKDKPSSSRLKFYQNHSHRENGVTSTSADSSSSDSSTKKKDPNPNGSALKDKDKKNVFLEWKHPRFEEQISKIDFIPFDWIQQWLDETNPPPPLEHKMLACEHGKLRPPLPNVNTCLYKVVPSEFVDALQDHYTIDGPRFQGEFALCRNCVELECGKLRKLQELENDYKLFMDLMKKLEAAQKSNTLLDSDEWETFYLSKEAYKSWKKIVKKRIEREFSDGSEVEILLDGEVSEPATTMNEELKCDHDKMYPEETGPGRKLISIEAWTIIAKYFPNAVALPSAVFGNCDDCRKEEAGNSVNRELLKQQAQNQKTALLDIYQKRGRPETSIPGVIYIIPQNTVDRWKRFVRENGRLNPVTCLENNTLLCEHNKFLYPLNYLAESMDLILEAEEEKVFLVWPEEWEKVKEIFQVDLEIKLEVSEDGQLSYEPEECKECAQDWWMGIYRKRFEYCNKVITVRRRSEEDKKEKDKDKDIIENAPSPAAEEDEDYPFVKIPRKRKTRDPERWESTNGNGNNKPSSSPVPLAVRKSTRPRRHKSEKCYRVSSTTTVKELKVMICKDFEALPSDQHLFFDGEEITNALATLGELTIPPSAVIYIEIDKAEKGEELTEPPPIETGFRGTLLMGMGEASPSPNNNNNGSVGRRGGEMMEVDQDEPMDCSMKTE